MIKIQLAKEKQLKLNEHLAFYTKERRMYKQKTLAIFWAYFIQKMILYCRL